MTCTTFERIYKGFNGLLFCKASDIYHTESVPPGSSLVSKNCLTCYTVKLEGFWMSEIRHSRCEMITSNVRYRYLLTSNVQYPAAFTHLIGVITQPFFF